MTSETRIMAAINVSPESFYVRSVADRADAVRDAVREAEAAGAVMIDIGAMSTAPYKETQISASEEVARMTAAVRVARETTSLAISADTQRAVVAAAAIDAGATIVNDVTALAGDAAMGALCAERDVRVVLMANDDPDLDEAGQSPIAVTLRLLEQAIARADTAGIGRDKLIIDPGIGFFRHRSISPYDWDLAVLGKLTELKILGMPVLVGASRKSFVGKLLGRPNPADRLAGSLAIAAWCVAAGVEWVRVHDVAETRDVLKMWNALSESSLR